MEFTLRSRRLDADDGAALHSIYKRVCEAAKFPIGPTWSREQLLEECAVGDGLILERVLDSTGQASGRSSDGAAVELSAFILFRDQVTAWEVTFLGSDPRFLKKGWMRRLLGEMQIEARSLGKEIWLEVHEGNSPARGLYVSLGFQQVGRRAKYYPDGAAAILYNFG